jgi:hypothetical protein
VKRTPLKRKTGLKPQSDKAKAKAVERRVNLLETFGYKPDCEGWTRLPVCPINRHAADDGHEPVRRSQGADPADPAQVIPLCRAAHDWVHANPRKASERYTAAGRPFLVLPSAIG